MAGAGTGGCNSGIRICVITRIGVDIVIVATGGAVGIPVRPSFASK